MNPVLNITEVEQEPKSKDDESDMWADLEKETFSQPKIYDFEDVVTFKYTPEPIMAFLQGINNGIVDLDEDYSLFTFDLALLLFTENQKDWFYWQKKAAKKATVLIPLQDAQISRINSSESLAP